MTIKGKAQLRPLAPRQEVDMGQPFAELIFQLCPKRSDGPHENLAQK